MTYIFSEYNPVYLLTNLIQTVVMKKVYRKNVDRIDNIWWAEIYDFLMKTKAATLKKKKNWANMDVRAGKKKKTSKGRCFPWHRFYLFIFFCWHKDRCFPKIEFSFFFSFFSFDRTGKNQNKKESLITKNAWQWVIG